MRGSWPRVADSFSAKNTPRNLSAPPPAQQAPRNSAPTPWNSPANNVVHPAPAGAAWIGNPTTKTSCALRTPHRPEPSAGASGCWSCTVFARSFSEASARPPIRRKNLMRPERTSARPAGSEKLRANTVQLPRKECRPTSPRRNRMEQKPANNTPCTLRVGNPDAARAQIRPAECRYGWRARMNHATRPSR